jgi:glutamyl-tRNA reductase
LSKQSSASVEQVVQELMNRSIPKSERMRLLRELVRSGEDVPDELLEKALRRLMERLTD